MTAGETLESTLIRLAPRMMHMARRMSQMDAGASDYRQNVIAMLKNYFRFVRANAAFLRRSDARIMACIASGSPSVTVRKFSIDPQPTVQR